MHFTTLSVLGSGIILLVILHSLKATSLWISTVLITFRDFWSIKVFHPDTASTGLSRSENVHTSIDKHSTLFPLSSRSVISTFYIYTGYIKNYSHATAKPATRFAFTRGSAMLNRLFMFNPATMFLFARVSALLFLMGALIGRFPFFIPIHTRDIESTSTYYGWLAILAACLCPWSFNA